MGYGLDTRFIDTAQNYRQLQRYRESPHFTNHHSTHTKPFLASCFFISRSLATASNAGNSSASPAQFFPSSTLVQNSLPAFAQLNWIAISPQPPLQSPTAHNTQMTLSYHLVWPAFFVM
jgi:hypothetical protein